MFEIFRRVITFAEFQVHARTVDLDLNVAIAAVAQRIVALISKDVIDRRIFLHAVKNLAQVVGIQESLAAGIACQSGERFLAGEVLVQLVANAGA